MASILDALLAYYESILKFEHRSKDKAEVSKGRSKYFFQLTLLQSSHRLAPLLPAESEESLQGRRYLSLIFPLGPNQR